MYMLGYPTRENTGSAPAGPFGGMVIHDIQDDLSPHPRPMKVFDHVPKFIQGTQGVGREL